jgi:hypothetical protein
MGRLAAEVPAPDVAHFTVPEADERIMARYAEGDGIQVEYVLDGDDESDDYDA